MTYSFEPLLPTPLGLPGGSVRALMALSFSGTLWSLLLQGRNPPTALFEVVLVIMVFYFGIRGTTIHGQAAPTGRHPLHLPRGSIRTILFLGFAAVTLLLYQRTGSIPSVLFEISTILAGYLLGILAHFHLRSHAQAGRIGIATTLRHLQALIILALTAFFCYSFLYGLQLPQSIEGVALPMVAFYFGSRIAR